MQAASGAWPGRVDAIARTIAAVHHDVGQSGVDAGGARRDRAPDEDYRPALRAGRLVAIDCINRGADFLAAKKLIAEARPIDSGRAADPEVRLAAL